MGSFYVLSELPLDDLVAAAHAKRADDTEEMAEILRRFDRAVRSIARSATSDLELRFDAAQGARLGLVKAVRAHTAGTAGFTTYAWRYMKGEALRTVKSMQTPEAVVDPTEFAWPEVAPRDAAPDSTLEVVDLLNVLTVDQRRIATAHYVDDVSFVDIAAQLRISKAAVTQRFHTIHRALLSVVKGALAA